MTKEKLYRLVKKIFINYGLNNNHASISSKALINAELVGAYGHGLSRIKMYCDRLKKKIINPKPKIKIKKYLNQLLILMLIIVLDLYLQILLSKKQSKMQKKLELV